MMENYYIGIAIFLMLLCLIPLVLIYIILDKKVKKDMSATKSLIEKVQNNDIELKKIISYHKTNKYSSNAISSKYQRIFKILAGIKIIIFILMFTFFYCVTFHSNIIISFLKKCGI